MSRYSKLSDLCSSLDTRVFNQDIKQMKIQVVQSELGCRLKALADALGYTIERVQPGYKAVKKQTRKE